MLTERTNLTFYKTFNFDELVKSCSMTFCGKGN